MSELHEQINRYQVVFQQTKDRDATTLEEGLDLGPRLWDLDLASNL